MGNSPSKKQSMLEMVNRMEENLNRFEKQLVDHFTHDCPNQNLEQLYLDSLANAHDLVQKYKRFMLQRPLTSTCFDMNLKSEMYETVDEFVLLVNAHFANCPRNRPKSRSPLPAILEE